MQMDTNNEELLSFRYLHFFLRRKKKLIESTVCGLYFRTPRINGRVISCRDKEINFTAVNARLIVFIPVSITSL